MMQRFDGTDKQIVG